ncbi:MAG: hypothetical protein ACK4YM_08940 [Novosphingobium sp.]
MIVRPELQALRGKDAPQRQAQAAVHDVYEVWRAGPGGQAERELARFGQGANLDDLPLLAALFAPDDDAADRFVGDLIARLLARLADDPLTQSPLRFSSDEAATTLVLARSGTAVLTLHAIDGTALARRPAPASVSFPPAETFERILRGSAEAWLVTLLGSEGGKARLAVDQQPVWPGDRSCRIGHREARLLRRVEGILVSLRLQRRCETGEVTREYALADGTLLHQAAGCPRDSRLELAAALLGRMGRSDAAPLLAAMAEEQGSPALRWQALRECLALDSAAGFAALCRIARAPDDPLAVPAGALRAQLLEAHPQLSRVCPCPA